MGLVGGGDAVAAGAAARVRAGGRARGIAVISDEIMCGLGRHGQEPADGRHGLLPRRVLGLQPDAVTFGKAIGGGAGHLLSGAALLRDSDKLASTAHGTALQSHTYAGSSARALLNGASLLDAIPSWRPKVQKIGATIGAILSELEEKSGGAIVCHGQGAKWGGIFAHEDAAARQAASVVFKKKCLAKHVLPYFVPVGGFMLTPRYDDDPDALARPWRRPRRVRARGRARWAGRRTRASRVSETKWRRVFAECDRDARVGVGLRARHDAVVRAVQRRLMRASARAAPRARVWCFAADLCARARCLGIDWTECPSEPGGCQPAVSAAARHGAAIEPMARPTWDTRMTGGHFDVSPGPHPEHLEPSSSWAKRFACVVADCSTSGGDELARANARVVELEARLKAESERCAALQVALRVADPSSDGMDRSCATPGACARRPRLVVPKLTTVAFVRSAGGAQSADGADERAGARAHAREGSVAFADREAARTARRALWEAAAFAAERRKLEKMMLAHTRERESWHAQTLALRQQLSEALRARDDVPVPRASSLANNGGPPAPPIRGAMPLSAARGEADMPIHVSKPARAQPRRPCRSAGGDLRQRATAEGGLESSAAPALLREWRALRRPRRPRPRRRASSTPTRSPARSQAPSPPTPASQPPRSRRRCRRHRGARGRGAVLLDPAADGRNDRAMTARSGNTAVLAFLRARAARRPAPPGETSTARARARGRAHFTCANVSL